MAYTKPTYQEHGDYPLASNLNKFSGNDVEINNLIGKYNLSSGFGAYAGTYKLWYFLYNQRYLVYRGAGSFEDGLGIEDDVSLNSTDTTTFDLDTVEWLYPGRLIRVADVEFAFLRG